jgi:Lysyl oxidase
MKSATLTALTAVVVLVAGIVALTGRAAGGPTADTTLYPDLRTVVPQHLQLVNQQQRETLRFSNGIANTGGGPWALRPEHELVGDATTTAIQEIRSNGAFYKCGEQPKQVTECYTVLQEHVATTFEFHPTHNHWHTGQVARFEIRKGSPAGSLVGGQSVKVGFCLIDLVRLDGNAPTSEKVFWDCYTSYQGVSAGWIDQYHQATDGQQLDLTGAKNGNDYYLVSTTNPDKVFLEQSTTNNTAWVHFSLSADSNGNRKVTVLGNSPCDSPGLCGAYSPNR